MGYLYADLTPFPHDTNYIELIRAVTESCAALLQVDANMALSRQRVDDEKAKIEGVLAEFHRMAGSMADVLQPFLTREDSPVIKEVANRLVQSIHGVLETARGSIQAGHESNSGATSERIRAEREHVLPALAKLLLHYELPGTVWAVRWASAQVEGQRGDARAVAMTPPSLEVLFQLDLTAPPWSSTVRVADVKQRVTIQLPRKARRGAVNKPAELDRYNITEVAVGEAVTKLVLRKALRPGSSGLELVWQGSGLSILALDDDTMPSEPIGLEASDAAVVADLRRLVEKQVWSLVGKRVRVVQAKLAGTEVQQLDSPAPLARMMIKTVAQHCREIVKRTPVEGELSLKRVVEDRRREEIFIKASDLTTLYAALPPSHQAFFDELGLPGARREEPAPVAPIAQQPVVKDSPLAAGDEVVLQAMAPTLKEIPIVEPRAQKPGESSPKVIVELAAQEPSEGKRD